MPGEVAGKMFSVNNLLLV